MPRLRNKVTGVVVNVSDDAATTLGTGWVRADTGSGAESKPAPRRASRRKK